MSSEGYYSWTSGANTPQIGQNMTWGFVDSINGITCEDIFGADILPLPLNQSTDLIKPIGDFLEKHFETAQMYGASAGQTLLNFNPSLGSSVAQHKFGTIFGK